MRPFIHVNCAMSADGKIAGPERRQVTISSDEDKRRVKNLRTRYDAILVGVGTVVSDDPHLTVKGLSYEENPVRIVIDPHGRTPDGALVLNGAAPTVIITDGGCQRTWGNTRTIRCKGEFDLRECLEHLADEGLESIMVEGGGETIASFFREGLVDRYTVYVGGLIIGGRDSPTPADGPGWVSPGGAKLMLKNCETLGNGVLLTFEPEVRS